MMRIAQQVKPHLISSHNIDQINHHNYHAHVVQISCLVPFIEITETQYLIYNTRAP